MTTTFGEHIEATITTDYAEGTLNLSLVGETDPANAVLPAILGRLMTVMMVTAEYEFGIKGTYIERHKPDPLQSP